MSPNAPMYVLQTGHEHLNVLLEAAFFILVGSCFYNCGPFYAIVSSPQYTVFGN